MRDGISEWVSALAVMATVCEAIALEVRHGQRTEVRELEEPFGSGQKGSQRDAAQEQPDHVRADLPGWPAIVRAQVVPVMEGIPLWHERDISHSSTERIALPDAAIGTDYLLHLTSRLVNGLVVDTDRMRANLDVDRRADLHPAPCCSSWSRAGLSREDAYALTQAAAMETWESGVPFRETLRKHAADAGRTLDEERLDEVCRPERYLERLAGVFDRVRGADVKPTDAVARTGSPTGTCTRARSATCTPSATTSC